MKWFIAILVGLILISASQQVKDKTADGLANVVQGVGSSSINSSQIITGYDIRHEPVYDRNGQMIAMDTTTQPVIIKIAVIGTIILLVLGFKLKKSS